VIKNLANILKLKLPQLIKTVLTTFSEFPNELMSSLCDFFLDNLTVRDVLFSIEEYEDSIKVSATDFLRRISTN